MQHSGYYRKNGKRRYGCCQVKFLPWELSEHKERIETIRNISQRLNKPIAIIQDLSGPKIRIGSLDKESITLRPNDTFILTATAVKGDEEMVSITYKQLPENVFARRYHSVE